VSKRDEVTEDWRSLYYEELYDLYSTPTLRMGWADHVARRGKSKGSYGDFGEEI